MCFEIIFSKLERLRRKHEDNTKQNVTFNDNFENDVMYTNEDDQNVMDTLHEPLLPEPKQELRFSNLMFHDSVIQQHLKSSNQDNFFGNTLKNSDGVDTRRFTNSYDNEINPTSIYKSTTSTESMD